MRKGRVAPCDAEETPKQALILPPISLYCYYHKSNIRFAVECLGQSGGARQWRLDRAGGIL